MKEEKFLEELKTRGFHYSEPGCETHYGDDLCFRSIKLAYVKGYNITTTKITYWIRFSDSLDEYVFGFILEGFHGPDAGLATSTFAEILNFLNIKKTLREKVPRSNPDRFQVRKY